MLAEVFMGRWFSGLAAMLTATALIIVSTLTMRAQSPPVSRVANEPARASLQDALLLPYSFHFSKPTPLDDVARELAKDLKADITIDMAALDRQGLKIDDEVQLSLDGKRLKTGLKLLLDQLDLSYKVIPEDNLMIITDGTGSDNPIDQILVQIKTLHKDVHDLQDAVDEIRSALGLDEKGGPRMHKPTIIEEMPGQSKEKEAAKPGEAPAPKTPERSRPGA